MRGFALITRVTWFEIVEEGWLSNLTIQIA